MWVMPPTCCEEMLIIGGSWRGQVWPRVRIMYLEGVEGCILWEVLSQEWSLPMLLILCCFGQNGWNISYRYANWYENTSRSTLDQISAYLFRLFRPILADTRFWLKKKKKKNFLPPPFGFCAFLPPLLLLNFGLFFFFLSFFLSFFFFFWFWSTTWLPLLLYLCVLNCPPLVFRL